MTAAGLSLGRDYCEIGCLAARELGFTMRREERNGQTRFTLRSPDGRIQSGEWREDPRRALVSACRLLPL